MYKSDSVKCDIKKEFDDWESKFTPGGWRASGLYDTLEDCCSAHFHWDIDNCMAISPNDAGFSFEFKLSDLKAPVSCQEADEIAEELRAAAEAARAMGQKAKPKPRQK